VSGVYSVALGGMNQAMASVDRAAERITQATQSDAASDGTGTDMVDLTKELVNMKLSQTSYDAAATVLKIADQMNGELINLLA